jgi:hypothetical protein
MYLITVHNPTLNYTLSFLPQHFAQGPCLYNGVKDVKGSSEDIMTNRPLFKS